MIRIAAAAACGAGVGLLVILVGILDENFHPVVEGRIYRSAQLDADELAEHAEAVGLASIVAVRAARPHKAWYRAEQATAARLGLPLVNVGMNADRMPSRQRLQRLVREIDAAPRPLLLHCRAGVERSGLASAVALLLEGRSIERARTQFSLRYGFHPWLAQTDLPLVLDRYAAWLDAANRTSSASLFRDWVEDVYVAAFYAAELEIVAPPRSPRVGDPLAFGLRVTNASPEPIRFRSSRDAGVHIGTFVERVGDPDFELQERSGLEDLELAPTGSHTFAIELAPLPDPGRYRLRVDLVDESVAWFADMGSTPQAIEFDVADRVAATP